MADNLYETLDQKLHRVFPGKVVRKDLLHQIRGGENEIGRAHV